MSKSRLLSGKVRKKQGLGLDATRHDYLDLANAEPDLGLPAADASILIGDQDGSRYWSKNLFADLTGSISVSQIASADGSSAINIVNNVISNSSVEVQGTLSANDIYTSLIDSTDSSEIVVVPAVIFNSDITVENNLFSDNITSNNITVDGDAVITGNLTVQGTTTTINSTTLAVEDKNIELAKGSTTAEAADGAGITVVGPATSATLTYSSADDTWNFNKTLKSSIIGNVTGDLTGRIFTTEIDSPDSSSITVTPTVVMQSDLTVENDLTVTNDVSAENFYGYFNGRISDISDHSLGELYDIDITTVPPQNNQGLVWNASLSKFVPGVTSDQELTTTSDVRFASLAIDSLETQTISTEDSSAINIIPAVIFNSDITVENDAFVANDLYVTNRIVGNLVGQVSDVSNHSIGELSDVDLSVQPLNNQTIVWNAAQGKFLPGDSFSQNDFDTAFGIKTTDDLQEGVTNLYFTEQRSRDTISAGTGVGYIGSTGEISIGQDVATTADVTFNSVTANIITTSIDSADSSEVVVSTSMRINADLTVENDIIGNVIGQVSDISNHSIDELFDVDISTVPPQNGQILGWNGTNFVPTSSFGQSDFDSALSASTTDELPEGVNNLYFLDSRARDAVTNQDLTFGNITTTGYIRGPAEFIIDPASYDDSTTGTVIIYGNLQIEGTTTTINSTTVEVNDKNLFLANGSTNAAAANGAGITVDLGIDGTTSIIYNAAENKWQFDKIVDAEVTAINTSVFTSKQELSGLQVESSDILLLYDVSAGEFKKATIANTALQGPLGYTGSQGNQGLPGYAGSQGIIGYTGSQGETGPQGIEGGTVITVTNSGFNYLISGLSGNFPTLTLIRGFLYYFDLYGVEASHPFALRLADQNTSAIPGTGGNDPVNGVRDTVITYRVPLDAPDSLVYQCTAHSSMIGQIVVTDHKGYTGSKGEAGTSVRIIGSVATVQDLPDPYNGDIGDAYIVQSTGDLWIWDGTQWNNAGQIRGYTGSQGDIGYTGSQGDTGFVGSQGDIGYTGSIGYSGSQGTPGTSVTIVGSVPDYLSLPDPYNGNIGDGYITQDSGHLWIWDGTQFYDVGQVRGYTGSRGERGYTGSIGYTGSQGEVGFVGSQGNLGYTGSVGPAGPRGFTGSRGESSFTWGATPPLNPEIGARWYDTTEGVLTVYVDDGDSQQWVEVSATGFLGQTGYTGSSVGIGKSIAMSIVFGG